MAAVISLWHQWLLVLLLGFFQSIAHAYDAPTSDQFQPVPALTGPVVDLTGSLDAQQREQLSQKLRALNKKYGAQMQVLLVPSTQPETAFDYSLRVVEQWQLGTKEKDDGLLLLIVKNDRKTWIQTGYGLEGVIPDIVAKSLLRDTLAPFLRNGDFAGGINAVIDAAYQRISGEVTAMPEPERRHRKSANPDWLMPLIVGAICIAVLSNIVGGFLASGVGGGGVFLFVWLFLGATIVLAVVLALVAILLSLFFRFGGYGGGFGGGGSFGGGGGWSGGGGGFGGGGAGGDW